MIVTSFATNLIAKSPIHVKCIALRKITLLNRIQILLAAILLIGGGSLFAQAADSFALAPSGNDSLVVFGPKGERVAELSVPTISKEVTVGSTSFQISYGRDASNDLTAILAPSSSKPQELQFTVLNKSITASKQAVVTLTFPDARHVSVDPGYVGTVSVNSHTLRHRELVDSAPPAAPRPSTAQTAATPVVKQSAPVPAKPAEPRVATTSTTTTRQTTSSVSNETDVMPSSDGPTAHEQTGSLQPSALAPPPLVGSLMAQPPLPTPKGIVGAKPPPQGKLFWAEPITPPSGNPPTVGIDQMKLVAVHGPVTLKLPNGETKTGANGMIVPSGTSITTADKGSAAVFMGGVDSVRLLPGTEAKVSQKIQGSTRQSNVDLKVGTLFSRVGHRPGEAQDFQVHTPEGVAAARGTSFSVTVTTTGGHEVTICATQEGVVTLTDSSNGRVITITPLNSGQVSIGSVPGLPISTLRDIFIAFMTELQQFNTNMLAIAANPNPTAAEQAYYSNNFGFDSNTQFYDVNAGSLAILFLNPSDTNFMDRTNAINYVIPGARRAMNQQLEPFGNVPVTPF